MEDAVQLSNEAANRNLIYCALLLNVLRRKDRYLILHTNVGNDGVGYVGYYYPPGTKQDNVHHCLLIRGMEEDFKTTVTLELHNTDKSELISAVSWTYDHRQEFDAISKSTEYGGFFGDFLDIQKELISLSGNAPAAAAEEKEKDPMPFLRDPPDAIRAFGTEFTAVPTLLRSGKVEVLPKEFIKDYDAKVGDYIARNPLGQIFLMSKTQVH